MPPRLTTRSFDFRLLGGATLLGTDGRPLAGPVAHRHRLAFLARLALARPGGVRRDKLVGLLWPERDDGSARALLRSALHEIRRALGAAAIIATGEELQLDPLIVRCDVHAFEAALTAGDPEGAVAAYGGPLLDGFFLDDAEDFERWVAQERLRLAGRYEQALASLATAAAGRRDPATAAAWLRRLAGQQPADTPLAGRLVDALVEAGDVAGALAHAVTHAAYLRAEFGIAPDTAFTVRVEALRRAAAAGPAPAAPAAPAPVAALPEVPPGEEVPVLAAAPAGVTAAAPPSPLPAREAGRRGWWGAALGLAAAVVVIAAIAAIMAAASHLRRPPAVAPSTIAVAPFTLVGAVPRELAEGLPDLLAVTLDQVAEVRVVPSRIVLARAAALAADGDVALTRLASAVKANAVLGGVIVPWRGGIEVRATLTSSVGIELAHATARGTLDDLPALVDQLSVGVLRELWGRQWAIPAPELAAIITTGPEALLAYIRGEAFLRRARWDSAASSLARAVDLDSTFALAHLRLAEAYSWRTSPGSVAGQRELLAAVRLADRLPPRERGLLDVRRLHEAGDLAAVARAETLAQRYPDDPEVQYMRADVRFHALPTAGEAATHAAATAFDSVEALDGETARVYVHPLALALERGDSVRFDHIVARLTALARGNGTPAPALPDYALLRTVRWSAPAAAHQALVERLRTRPPAPDETGGLLTAMERTALLASTPAPALVLDVMRTMRATYRDTPRVLRYATGRQLALLLGTGQFATSGADVERRWQQAPTRIVPEIATALAFGEAPPEWVRQQTVYLDRAPIATATAAERRRVAYWRGIVALAAGDVAAGRSALRLAGARPSAPMDSIAGRLAGALTGAEGWARLLEGDTTAAIALMESAERRVGYDEEGLSLNRPAHVLLLRLLARRPERRAEAIDRIRGELGTVAGYPWAAWHRELGAALAAEGDAAGAAAERARVAAFMGAGRRAATTSAP